MTIDEALEALARVRTLLVATDFDGTLAPIVPDPPAARALPASVAAVRDLVALPGTAVAVVSGRSLSDLRALCAASGLPDGPILVGGHGTDRGDCLPASLQTRRDSLVAAVTTLAGPVPGVLLEEKAGGIAVHVRGVSAPGPLLDRLRDLAIAHEATTTDGILVLELSVVPGSKGAAVAALRAELGADAVVFLGDDLTDESVFATLGPADLGVKVGGGPSVAGQRVLGPPDVARLLAELAARRAARAGTSGPAIPRAGHQA